MWGRDGSGGPFAVCETLPDESIGAFKQLYRAVSMSDGDDS